MKVPKKSAYWISISLTGTKLWYKIKWFGSCSDFWFVIFGPVRNGSVRFVFFKRLFFPNRTVYEPTYLVRNRFGPIFRKKYFYFFVPITDRANYVPNKLVRNRFGPKNQFFEKYGPVRISWKIFSKISKFSKFLILNKF